MKVVEMTLLLNEHREIYLTSKGCKKDLPKNSLRNPSAIYEWMCANFQANQLPEEHVWALYLGSEYNVITVFEISKGTYRSSLVSSREVLRNALMCDAKYFVLLHNHPSGNITPSTADKATTKKMTECGNLMELPMIDHIIIGNHSFFSFKQDGFIK